ncbi:MAG: NFACT family protein [Candidatus Gastranaerophilales bacterium]|nr:NFACT family protein [Candidatus Gastranaerophilales bacterium]
MINLDSLTIKAFLEETQLLFESCRVQKIQQPSRHELILSIRTLGKSQKLYININPKYPHICFLTEVGQKYRNIEIPQQPPMFCMLLRKHMEGTKINAVIQPDNERIIELYFESYDAIGGKIPLVMAIELMGKHSNIILYNKKTNIIIGCAHNIGPEKSRERELAGTLPYIYPPAQTKTNLLEISKNDFYNMAKAIQKPINQWLNKTFYDVSLALANELCEFLNIEIVEKGISAISQEKILQIYDYLYEMLNLECLNPVISADKNFFSLFGLQKDDFENRETVNELIDEYFGYQMFKDTFGRMQKTLLNVAEKEIKKQKTAFEKQQKILDSILKIEKYKEFGDVIISNLYRIKTIEPIMYLENPYNENKAEEISFDTALTANENAQKYYKLYNKKKNAVKIAQNMSEKTQEEINYLESIKISINQAVSIKDLTEIKEELVSQNLLKAKVLPIKKQKEQIDLLQFDFENEVKIYVGKNNKQNDYLISKIASPFDIWLHVQNTPGSHVLIKIPKQIEQIPDEILLKAAQLAVKYSFASKATKVPVIYTLKKYLKKPPCAKPGYVTYSNEKTIFIENN